LKSGKVEEMKNRRKEEKRRMLKVKSIKPKVESKRVKKKKS
jgi:hypothetical protein